MLQAGRGFHSGWLPHTHRLFCLVMPYHPRLGQDDADAAYAACRGTGCADTNGTRLSNVDKAQLQFQQTTDNTGAAASPTHLDTKEAQQTELERPLILNSSSRPEQSGKGISVSGAAVSQVCSSSGSVDWIAGRGWDEKEETIQ